MIRAMITSMKTFISTTMKMIFKDTYQVTARNLEKKEAVAVYILTSLDKFILHFLS